MESSARTWLLEDEPVPVRLMATLWADTSGSHDDLDSPAGLQAWMHAVGIDHTDTLPGADDLADARRLRDALRSLASHQTEDTRPGALSPITDPTRAVEVLNAAASRLPAAQLQLDNGSFRIRPEAATVPASLATIATEAIDLFGGNDASHLRACQAPGCVLYFVKRHPRREWCSVACGNRARAARHYERTRHTAQPASAPN